jgi:hypothetical protein
VCNPLKFCFLYTAHNFLICVYLFILLLFIYIYLILLHHMPCIAAQIWWQAEVDDMLFTGGYFTSITFTCNFLSTSPFVYVTMAENLIMDSNYWFVTYFILIIPLRICVSIALTLAYTS